MAGWPRPTTAVDSTANALDLLWRSADALWRPLQAAVVAFINGHEERRQSAPRTAAATTGILTALTLPSTMEWMVGLPGCVEATPA
jgi:hypothetical protein